MLRKLVSILAVASAAFLVVAATGCGGDKSSSDTDTTAVESIESEDSAAGIEETEDEAEDADGTDEDTDTTGMDEETTSSDDVDDDIDMGALASEDCQELGQVGAKMSEAFGGTPSSDTEAYSAYLREFAEEAPEEIRADFQVLADAYSKMAEAFEGFDPSSGSVPPADVLARIQELSQEIDQAAVATASTNISQWVTENCAGG